MMVLRDEKLQGEREHLKRRKENDGKKDGSVTNTQSRSNAVYIGRKRAKLRRVGNEGGEKEVRAAHLI